MLDYDPEVGRWTSKEQKLFASGYNLYEYAFGDPVNDLTNDIGEENNVAAANAEIVAKIEDYLKGARTESEFWPLRGE